MELLHHFALGFEVAFTPQNLLYAFFGAALGMLIGVLPGLGSVAMIAMLLPSIYLLDATPAFILLAGVYGGAQYGRSISAILTKVPSESSPVVTAIEAHQLARQGRAGPALAAAGLGSFFAGCVGTFVIAAFAAPLTAVASHIGPAEYFALMVLGLIGAVVLASGSLVKATAMSVLGVLLSQVETGVFSGSVRDSVKLLELGHGVGFVVIAIGLFGLGEIIANLGRPAAQREVFAADVKGLWPTKRDFLDAWPAALRGTALGAVLGVLPGGGASLASGASYSVENKLAGPGSRFGKGDIRGVAGPESAHNAAAQTSFIPMLTLGIPPHPVMALMVGAMTIKGIEPGPQMVASNPSLFWGLIASMWVGNAMLLVLNLPLIGLWIKLLSVPYRFLFPAIGLLCCIGVYSLNGKVFDIYLMAGFALLGYVFHKLGCAAAPLLLGFILGPMMEENLLRALLLSGGDWSTFLTRPLSAGLLALAALMVVIVLLPSISKKREATFREA